MFCHRHAETHGTERNRILSHETVHEIVAAGGSGLPGGVRTYSAGKCFRTASITHVRQKPVTTAIRRATAEGLNLLRTSCIYRT